MAADSKTLLLRLFRFLVYVLIGAAVFMLIESDADRNFSTRTTFEDLQIQWITIYNLSRENITKMLQEYDRAKEIGTQPTWNFLNSVYFVLQLVTTIGYGNITPRTPSGQFFTIVYAIGGIPLTILALKSIGETVNSALRIVTQPLHRKFHTTQCDEHSCNFVEKENVLINSVCLGLTWILLSTVLVAVKPQWHTISSFYSIFVTYSTIGFGDFIPFESQQYAFVIIFLPGLSFMSSLVDSAIAYVEKSNWINARCFNLRIGCRQEGDQITAVTTDVAQQNTENVTETSM